jgi:outer membrane biogenesis lipoprotein LolB
MARVFLLVLVVALLAGCADSEPLPQPSGPLFALNPGLWQPSAVELENAPKVGPR